MKQVLGGILLLVLAYMAVGAVDQHNERHSHIVQVTLYK